jgi:patatin-like phospholipase/acyl hydrolase
LTTPCKEESNGRSGEPIASAQEIFEFYKSKGSFIFPPVRHNLSGKFKNAFNSKYNGKNLYYFIDKLFKQATMDQLLTNVLVSSYDTENREPFFFKHIAEGRHRNTSHEENNNFFVRDIARATTAAPIFFPPAHIKPIPDSGKTYSLIDGGVFVNNPSLCAYIEALKQYPRTKRFIILSLGTGVVDRPYPYEEIRKWGYMDWMSLSKGMPLLDMMMDGQRDTADHLLDHLPNVEYYRLDFSLDDDHTNMDNASEANITYLEEKANQIIEQNTRTLRALCRTLYR